jgi:hypothetical protein
VSCVLSSVTIAETRYGIERLPAADSSRKRQLGGGVADDELRPWFSDRLLEVSEDAFVVWRRLVEQGREMRHTFPQPDLFIAATAILHDLCVVTRDTGDFLRTGVFARHSKGRQHPRQGE